MAVCGRCLICGHKFSCDDEDEAIRWRCKTCDNKPCAHCGNPAGSLHGPGCRSPTRRYGDEEPIEHAICTTCHNGLVNGSLERDVELLVSLVASRSASQQRE